MEIQNEEYLHVTHPLLDDFKKESEKFKEEAEKIYKNNMLLEWLSKQIYNEGWKVLGTRYEGKTLLNESILEHCPVLTSFFKKYEPYIYSLAYSSLNPGTEIFPHFDRKSPHDVLRCHLGLIIPQGDCKLKVNGKEKKWNEGEFLIFDDSFIHEAWNHTNEKRIVLLIDLHRSKIFNDLDKTA